MKTKAFSSIIHLRYQLFKRLLFTKSRLKIWLPQFISVLFLLLVLSFILLKEGTIHAIFLLLTSGNRSVVTGILFAILLSWGMTTIFYILIIGTNLSGQFSFSKISYLPISPFSFYFSELLASFVDIWTPILFIALTALVVGIDSSFSPGKIIAHVIFVISFIITLSALSQFLIYFFNSLFKFNQKNWLKKLFSFLLFLLLFFIAAFPMVLISKELSKNAQSFSEFFYYYHLNFTPFGLAAEGFSRLNFNESLSSVLLPLILLMGYAFVFFTAGYFIFKKSLSKTSVGTVGKPAKSKRLMVTVKLLSPLFKEKAIFIGKELTYMSRSPRVIVFCITGVLLMLVNLLNLTIRRPEFNLMLFIWLIYPALILLIDSSYFFSYDEKATKSYFFAPISFKDFIFSKNTAVFLFIFSFQILLIIGAFIFLHLPRAIVSPLSAILVVGYLIFSYLVIVNKISIENPATLKFNSIFSRSNTNIGFSFGGLVVILIPVIVLFIFFNKSTVLLLASYAFLLLLAIVFYFVMLAKFPEKLVRKQESFIKKISG